MLGTPYAVYLQFNSHEKTLSPFVPNSALPESGTYRGEALDLVTKSTRRASVMMQGHAIRFVPRFSDHPSHLQRFIFSPEDGKKK